MRGALLKRLYGGQSYPLGLIVHRLSNRSFLYFISTEILILGAWAEDIFGRDLFMRSGACLALIGLLLLWLLLQYTNQLRTL